MRSKGFGDTLGNPLRQFCGNAASLQLHQTRQTNILGRLRQSFRFQEEEMFQQCKTLLQFIGLIPLNFNGFKRISEMIKIKLQWLNSYCIICIYPLMKRPCLPIFYRTYLSEILLFNLYFPLVFSSFFISLFFLILDCWKWETRESLTFVHLLSLLSRFPFKITPAVWHEALSGTRNKWTPPLASVRSRCDAP